MFNGRTAVQFIGETPFLTTVEIRYDFYQKRYTLNPKFSGACGARPGGASHGPRCVDHDAALAGAPAAGSGHMLAAATCAGRESAELCVDRAWGSEIVTRSAAVAEHDLTAPCSIYA